MAVEKTKTLEESVVAAMDGTDTDLFPFLPYILQDLWAMGSDPEMIVRLVRKQAQDDSNLKVLDLGCGKGAVSIKIAEEFKCACLGIDAVQEFIDEADSKAKEVGVDRLCRFEVGDIRERVKNLTGFDIIILGSIGSVFGDYFQTLTALEKCMVDNGKIIIDDGYVENDSVDAQPFAPKRDVVLQQISDSGMKLIAEVVVAKDYMKEANDFIYKSLKRRCEELIEKHPDKTALFKNYVKRQEEENAALEGRIVCAAMVVTKK
jgi:cyclopropane fatty-acyl-phospholipid synthase-like methyltransferase